MNKYLNVLKNNPHQWFWLGFQQLHRWLAVDYWWSKSGHACFPEQVTIILTKRCNFGCEKCSSKSPQLTRQLSCNQNYKNEYKELTTTEWKRVIDQLKNFYHPAVYFCGGEPTLRYDLIELIRYVKRRGMLAAMTSNGSLLDDHQIVAICQSGLDFVSFSIDGPPKYHNLYRKYPQAFERATAAIKKIVAYKKSHNLSRPSVKITSVLDPESPANGYYILNLARLLGVNEVAFGNLMFYTPKHEVEQKKLKGKLRNIGEYMIGLEVPNDFRFKNNRAAEITKFYREARRQHPNIDVVLNPASLDAENFYNPAKYPSLSPCPSTFSTATISPDGYLYHCQEYFIGNVREKSFRELWNDPKLRAFRMIKKKVQMPACFRCLEGQEIKFAKQ